MIGRSRTNPLLPDSAVDLRPIFAVSGGGGHAQAAATVLKGEQTEDLQSSFERALAAVRSQIPHPITAQSLMSSPVRTILPTTSVDEARRILLRYGHVGLCVVTGEGALVGIISRRDIDTALRHGLGHGPRQRLYECAGQKHCTRNPDYRDSRPDDHLRHWSPAGARRREISRDCHPH